MGVSWKGSISFGLIYIPIQLKVATRDEQIHFNQLHEKCHNRIKYKKVCEFCDEEVKSSGIIKGYEYESGQYITFSEEDFDRLKTEKDKSIQIQQFVDLGEIDPVYYEKAYYVVPSGGEQAYQLLLKAMEETNKVGIAKVILGSKENLVALRVHNGKMFLYKLFFANEIEPHQEMVKTVELNQVEIDLAKQLIANLTRAFQPEDFYDEYNERLKEAIEMKVQGNEIETPKDEPNKQMINLMDALQQSLRVTEGPRV